MLLYYYYLQVLFINSLFPYMYYVCIYLLHVHSHSIMNECWNDDKESRPTFLKLKEEFDGLISNEERYNYLPLVGDIAVEGPSPSVQAEAAAEDCTV